MLRLQNFKKSFSLLREFNYLYNMNSQVSIVLKDQNLLILLIHDLIQEYFSQRYHYAINFIRLKSVYLLTDEQIFLIRDKQVRKIIVDNRVLML